jgi:elongator complex protein 3
MGGNFLEYPADYQNEFVRNIYDALNGKKSRNLQEAKKKNEKAKHRCVALCIETRPDSVNSENIKKMLKFGCTRVELGVQCIDDRIYRFVNRGHTVKDVVNATKMLRDNGFKIGYHIMPGLPGSNLKKDFQMFVKLFKDNDFKPDQLKIYPCQVIKGTGLEKLYKRGRYKPYTQKQIESLLEKIMLIIPNYCRIMRIMREIPPDYLTAGVLRIDLRRDFESALKSSNMKDKIKEIRFREIGFIVRDKVNVNKNIKLKITRYRASNGEEYFLEIVNKDNILFGLLRLRINKGRTAFIREIHVYGQALEIGQKGKKIGQHSGFGKMLLKKAEEIARNEKIKELKIISGVGAREYYRKLGYKLGNEGYMEKDLK